MVVIVFGMENVDSLICPTHQLAPTLLYILMRVICDIREQAKYVNVQREKRSSVWSPTPCPLSQLTPPAKLRKRFLSIKYGTALFYDCRSSTGKSRGRVNVASHGATVKMRQSASLR